MRRKGLVITIWVLSLLFGWFLKNVYAEPMSAAMALIYGSAIGAGGGILGGLLGKGGGGDTEFDFGYQQLPDYPESEGARKDWWTKLQEWGKQPGYGAISPDWADIWDLAQKKVSQYYRGGTLDKGLLGRVQASAARRNVSQSPALENMIMSLGFQEAGDIKDLSKQEAINKATFSEQGRQNWLASLQSLSGMKPAFTTAGGAVPGSTYGAGQMIGDVTSAAGGALTNYANYLNQQQQTQKEQDWLTSLFKNAGGVGGGSLLSGYGSASPSTSSPNTWGGFDYKPLGGFSY